MCRAAIKGLFDGGAIVNVGVAAAEKAAAGMGPYAASKAGVPRLTESVAAELPAESALRRSAAVLDTPQNRVNVPGVGRSTWTAPDAVADAIAFLASDAWRAVTARCSW